MRVLQVLGARDGRPNASIVAQIQSLRRLLDVVPVVYRAGALDGYWRALYEVRDILKRGNVHMVHGHHSRSGYLAFWARAHKIPLVVSFLGTDLYNRCLVNRVTYRCMVRHASAIIVKSDRMRRLIHERQDVYVIPNGVDFSIFKPMDRRECRSELGLDCDHRYILFAANPCRVEKNFLLAQAAVGWLRTKRRMDKCTLLPVHGVSQSVLAMYMNACDCMIVTSHYEGSPNVVKEAMACNTRIVSVDVGDVRGLIGETEGCRTVEHDSRRLGDALWDVLSYGRATDGRVRVEHLRIERVARMISQVYESVVSV